MIPRTFMEAEEDDPGRIGEQARIMSRFLSMMGKYISEYNVCLLFINQLRSVIKKSKYDVGPEEETSGGRALRYYSSVRIKLRKSTVEKLHVISKLTGKKGEEPINVTVKATVVKNKIDKPWLSAPIYIRFGEGFDNILSVIELAINTNVIKKNGAFFTFQHKDGILKAQGKEQLRKTLDEQDQVFDQLRASLILKEDVEAKEEYQEQEKEDAMDDLLKNTSDSYIEKRKEKEEPEKGE
jgi:recombination protein RecA